MQAYDGFNTYTPSGSVFLDLEDMKEILRFPFTYGDSYMDYYSGLFFLAGIAKNQTGFVTVTADGYGTLITPAGTFHNVLRVKELNEYSNAGAGTPEHYNQTVYRWYHEDFRAVLYSITTTVRNGTDTFRNAAWLGMEGLAIAPKKISHTFRCYPNPTQEVLNIQFQLLTKNKVTISINDITGRQLVLLADRNFDQGEQALQYTISELPAGIYNLVFRAAGEAPVIQKLVKQ